jgi:hypothetical protein
MLRIFNVNGDGFCLRQSAPFSAQICEKHFSGLEYLKQFLPISTKYPYLVKNKRVLDPEK